jgi:pyruvate/2-oxoglutarate dehydrogenase complex dihydrolipoamide dehydrogenase (E3) component
MSRADFDLCVIGAGSAGLSVAAGAAQLGRRVALVEKGEMGGDCLNYGCVPSKALIAAARSAHDARAAARFGVHAAPPVIDFPAVMAHVKGVIAGIAPHDSEERFRGLGCDVIRAEAEFTGPRSVIAGSREITAKHFVIATGSRAVAPPIPGLDETGYLTNETIFSLAELPRRLIVIGGGPIGVELAQAFARLGSAVSVVEAQDMLGRESRDAAAIARQALESDGVRIAERAAVARVEKRGPDIILMLNNGEAITGDQLLVAAGRRATLDGLGLETAGVERDAKGALILDPRLRTTNRRIYAAGDAAGGAQFTHVAGDHASTIVRNILFKMPAKRRDALSPRVTYCSPEIASVGLGLEAARKRDPKAEAARVETESNDRARAERATEGFIEAVVGGDGRILGATIVGESAGDLIGLWSYAIAHRQKIASMTGFIAPYPTRGELSKRVGGAYYGTRLFSDRTRALIRWLSILD